MQIDSQAGSYAQKPQTRCLLVDPGYGFLAHLNDACPLELHGRLAKCHYWRHAPLTYPLEHIKHQPAPVSGAFEDDAPLDHFIRIGKGLEGSLQEIQGLAHAEHYGDALAVDVATRE